jgi:cytochrome P450
VVNVLLTILGGGFDTTMGLVCHALAWLSDHPNERQRLIDDPSLIPAAGEEFLRYFSPIQSLSRTVGEDTELCGQSLSFGDRVLLSFAGANRDPEAYDHPDEMILARFPNRHVAFGLGTHRCIGSNFARMEVTAMLQGVLERIPDYTVITTEAERYETIGNLNGFTRMPASFTPGSRLAR